MPKKNFIPIRLAPEQYDRCCDCPLCGLIPEKERKSGKRKKYACLGTLKALTSKGIYIRASKRSPNHPLHRPCDKKWDAWMTLKDLTFNLSYILYTKYRLPYEQTYEPRIDFDD
jgi:hypothetical protein